MTNLFDLPVSDYKPFVPSEYQRAIMDRVADPRGGSIAVIAVAGSGKTKTAEICLPLIPEAESVQMLAFNSTIAKELGARIDKLRDEARNPECPHYGRQFRNVSARTFHSLGGGAVAKKLGCSIRELNTDASKCRKLFELNYGELDVAMYGEFVCKLVSLAKGEGIGAIVPDTQERWYEIIRHHDLDLDSEMADEATAVDYARDLLETSNEAALSRNIDFDDMIYLPLLWKLRLWQNDWVIGDEWQDSNPTRRALAKLALKPGGRLMVLGDPRQAIYGFTGATHEAIEITKREHRAVEMPLTVSYRCAASIVEKAREIVDYIEPAPGAPEGRVETLPLDAALKVLDAHDAVLCRKTAPLITLAFRLIGEGRGCVVLGRDIGQGLVVLIKKLKASTVDVLEQRLQQYEEREIAKFTARGEENKAEGVSDRCACIRAVIEGTPEDDRSVLTLIRTIEGMFRDTNGVLTLCTVHKAKGKEWRAVAILEPECMPSPWARQEWQYEQERNLIYVAYTRAMEHLILLQS